MKYDNLQSDTYKQYMGYICHLVQCVVDQNLTYTDSHSTEELCSVYCLTYWD